MSAINLLEEATNPQYLPSKSFDELQHGEYKVKKFELVKTKHGPCLTTRFEDFFVWLPSRFATKIDSSKLVEELNTKTTNSDYIMPYEGRDSNRKL